MEEQGSANRSGAEGTEKPDGLAEMAQAGFAPAVAPPHYKPPVRKGPPVREDLSEDEFTALLSYGRRVLYHHEGTRRRLQAKGLNVVPAHFYSEIPTLSELDEAFDYREDEPFAAPFIEAERVAAAYAELTPHSHDFDPPVEEPETGHGFYWSNPAFSFCDAMVYYAMIRRHRPSRVVEIGSGHSTRVARRALADNGEGELTCFEPFPMDWLPEVVDDLRPQKAQEITAEAMNDLLADGDVFFIDSTHTVKFGSDCAHIYLRLLPNIRRRVFVHVHDIYLPYGFPHIKASQLHQYWTEQYLLFAFMLYNERCRFILGNVYGFNETPDAQRALMRGRYPTGGASWWFEWMGATD